MDNKYIKIIAGIVCGVAVLAFAVVYTLSKNNGNLVSGNNGVVNNSEIVTEATELAIDYTESELKVDNLGNYSAKITLADNNITLDGAGATISGSTVTIQKAGVYYITGSLSDGNIVVSADKSDDVQIVLDNVNLTSKTTSPINCIKAGKLTITLASGSVNTISDSENYIVFTDTEKEEPDATIFSKTDVVINGSGKLVVNSKYSDGIASKDGLKIVNANVEINSVDDGIRGKDYVAVKDSNISITSKGDGIKSTNSDDATLGYIAIDGGAILIKSTNDGISAETILNISGNSDINIVTSGDESSSSSKGLKAGKEVTIENGNIKISSTDDNIHSNGIVIINDGTFELSSGDDGIHADTNIVINKGNVNITKSYEGIESDYIEINGGTILVTASDDGINISGGKDGSAMMGRPGQNSFSSVDSSNRKLVINGGDIKVKATGDGLDANGSIYINGGNVLVYGTASNFNGVLDYDKELVITGGNILAYGSTGMWQNPSTSSTQYSLAFNISGKAGDVIVLKDSSNNEIASATTENSYGAILFSNSKIKNGETYTVYVNGTSSGSQTVSSIVTSNVSGGGQFGGRMPQGDFDPNNMPEGFEPGNKPEGFSRGDMPEGFEPGSRPEGFERGNRPEGFDPSNLPEDFDPSQMRGKGNKRGSSN